MVGKIIPLRPGARFSDAAGSEAWNSILDYVQPLYSESLDCLKREAAKASPLIRQAAAEKLNQGERICPALFLTIVKQHHQNNTKMVRYAASLEALDLALQIHRSIERSASTSAETTTAILAGDFFFSQSLTLAADAPIFIKGMAEIICRAVSSEVDGPSVNNSDIRLWRKNYLRKLSDGYASILALSATLAGWCCKMEPWENEALAYYGHYVGLGLQLKRELKRCQRESDAVLKIHNLNLPLIYVLEHSSYQKHFLALLVKESLRLNNEKLLQEHQKIKPEIYIEHIAGNCISRARERLSLLRGSLAHDAAAILNCFTAIQLV